MKIVTNNKLRGVFLREEVLFDCEKQHKTKSVLRLRNTCCFTAVTTVTYPTFLLSRNSDSLVLSLWNLLSLLQVRSLALLLHISDDRPIFRPVTFLFVVWDTRSQGY